MSSKRAEADIYNEITHGTIYSENESRILALRLKECHLSEMNLATCEGNRTEMISHGYYAPMFYESPYFLIPLGMFLGAAAKNNLGR